MRVDMAVQVLSVFLNKACLETNFALCIKVFSSSVSKALPLVYGDKARETAHFVGLVDKFSVLIEAYLQPFISDD